MLFCSKVEPTRKTEIRGRFAYDAEEMRFRILEDEKSPVAPEEFYGRYYYFKQVLSLPVDLFIS